MINNDIQFNIGEGLFPPAMISEPAFTAGDRQYRLLEQRDRGHSITTRNVPLHLTSRRSTPTRAGPPPFPHQFTGLADGQIYYYRVKANDGTKAESSWSATVSSTQDATAPSLLRGWIARDLHRQQPEYSLHGERCGQRRRFCRTSSISVDSGAYAQYGGTFASSPINFIIPGDGAYDFYTVATDNVGNEETATGIAASIQCVDGGLGSRSRG